MQGAGCAAPKAGPHRRQAQTDGGGSTPAQAGLGKGIRAQGPGAAHRAREQQARARQAQSERLGGGGEPFLGYRSAFAAELC